MPQRHKRKHHDHAQHRSRCTAEGDINIPDGPTIIRSMPSAPEADCRIVVAHATQHILRRVHSVEETPQPEEAPWDEELEPDDVQVKVADH